MLRAAFGVLMLRRLLVSMTWLVTGLVSVVWMLLRLLGRWWSQVLCVKLLWF